MTVVKKGKQSAEGKLDSIKRLERGNKLMNIEKALG